MGPLMSLHKDGVDRGCIDGRAEGRVVGRVEGEYRLLKRQLERRFDLLPAWATEKLSNASEQDLYVWGDAVLTAPTLEAVLNQKKFFREEPDWIETIISKSYEACYENGTLRWLGDKPSVKQASVIVTILSERERAIIALLKKSQCSSLLAGKGEVFGDITPVSAEEE